MVLGTLIRRLLSKGQELGRLAAVPQAADFGGVRKALEGGDTAAARAVFGELPSAARASAKGNELAGLIESADGRFDLASAYFEYSIAADPGRPSAQCNLGQCLQLLDEFDAAAEHLERALQLAPDFTLALHNLALVRYRQQQLAAAEARCRDVLRAEPGRLTTHILLSEVLLAQGRYAEAWPEFEWRRQHPGLLQLSERHPAPEWGGEMLSAGATLLLWAEQGYGDMFQFARFIPPLAERLRGVKVILACPESIHGVMKRIHGINEVKASGANPAEPHKQTALLSVPLHLAATASEVRIPVPYLCAAPEAAARFGAMLGKSAVSRVGLVWKSGRHPRLGKAELARNAGRDIDFEAFAGALPRGRLRYLALQLEHGLDSQHFAAAGVEDWSEQLRDFDDTAALLANLDLIVTVDTAMAHLAAAMGRSVWVLCKFDACWRWTKALPSSDWYPRTQRLFQHRPGDWSRVLRELRRKLDAFASETGEEQA